jgi:hypothetical protein
VVTGLVVVEEEVVVVVFFSFLIFLGFFTGLAVSVVVVVVLLLVVAWAVRAGAAGAAGAGVALVEVFLVVFFTFLVVFFPGLVVSVEVEEVLLLVVVLVLWGAAGLEDVWAKAGVMRAAATRRNNSFLIWKSPLWTGTSGTIEQVALFVPIYIFIIFNS